MRTLAILALAIAARSPGGADAQAREYPWCARYDAWSYNCGFATYQQCLATISGAGGFCQANPRAAMGDDPRPRTHGLKRRHRGR